MRSSSGGVYQPTTTGLNDPEKSWGGPTRFLGPGGQTTGGSRAWPKSMVLLLAGLFAVMGLVMVIVGSKWHHDLALAASTPVDVKALDEDTGGGGGDDAGGDGGGGGGSQPSTTSYVTILVVGLLLMVVAFAGLLAYYRSIGAGLPCCPGKIAHIRQRFGSHSKFSSGAPICAQYCPPTNSGGGGSDGPGSTTTSVGDRPTAVHHQQPTNTATSPPFADISEQQRLMSEDTDRMIEDNDPRIVLSPLKSSHEEC